MNRGQFIRAYAKRSGLTVRQIRAQRGEQLVAMRCHCGDASCVGWAMVLNKPFSVEWHRRMDGSFHKRLQDRVWRRPWRYQ